MRNKIDALFIAATFGAFFAAVVSLALWGYGLPTDDALTMFAILWVGFTLMLRSLQGTQ